VLHLVPKKDLAPNWIRNRTGLCTEGSTWALALGDHSNLSQGQHWELLNGPGGSHGTGLGGDGAAYMAGLVTELQDWEQNWALHCTLHLGLALGVLLVTTLGMELLGMVWVAAG